MIDQDRFVVLKKESVSVSVGKLRIYVWWRPVAKPGIFLRQCGPGRMHCYENMLTEGKQNLEYKYPAKHLPHSFFPPCCCPVLYIWLRTPVALLADCSHLPTICGSLSLGHTCVSLHSVSLWHPWIKCRNLFTAFGSDLAMAMNSIIIVT